MADVRSTRATDNVRIGPISVFTLIAVLCISILAVLAVSTAHASFVITDRQAQATDQLYRNETAAQTFIAELDAQLASTRGSVNAKVTAVKEALPQMCAAAEASVEGVETSGTMDGRQVKVIFTCDDMRKLEVKVDLAANGYHITQWKMKAVENEESPGGELWTGE